MAKLKGVNWLESTTLRANSDDESLQPGLEGTYAVVRHRLGAPAPECRDAYLITGVKLGNGACAGRFRETHLGEAWSRRRWTNLHSGSAKAARIHCCHNCGVDVGVLLQHKAYTSWSYRLPEARRAGRGPTDRSTGCGDES